MIDRIRLSWNGDLSSLVILQTNDERNTFQQIPAHCFVWYFWASKTCFAVWFGGTPQRMP
jgi:hypothetical protein